MARCELRVRFLVVFWGFVVVFCFCLCVKMGFGIGFWDWVLGVGNWSWILESVFKIGFGLSFREVLGFN